MKLKFPIKSCIGFLTILSLVFVFHPLLARCEDIVFNSSLDRFIYPEYSKTVSIDFKNAALQDVLKVFSQQSGLNFIASQEIIDKKITLFLDKVPVEEALERILDSNHLTYEIRPGSNIFVVKPLLRPEKELLTRVYYLKHATVSSSKLNRTITIGEEEGGGQGGVPAGGVSVFPGGAAEGAAGGTGLLAALQSVITKSGSIVEDPRTNSLIITDIPTQFPIIELTIARLDVPIPQIFIEVEMLDISKRTADLLGLRPGSTPLTFEGARRTHYYPWDENELVRAGKVAAANVSSYTAGTLSAAGLTATLQFLRTQSDTKNLARPRILTLNNETAEIKISTDEAIGVGTLTTGGEAGAASVTSQAERVETGVFLTVTPQANLQTNEITMAISPKVIEARTGGTFGGTTFRDPEERATSTILRVRNGETIIIGGLLRHDLADVKTKLPVFGDIPVLGAAFRHKDKTVTERELIVFITPYIVSQTTGPELALKESEKIIREQEIPRERRREIDIALATVENQRR